MPSVVGGQVTFTDIATTKHFDGTLDLDTDSFKVALLVAASNIGAATTTWAGVTGEVANGNGYTTGGIATVPTLTGTTTMVIGFTANPEWTASGAGFTFKYWALYKVASFVVCYCLYDETGVDIVATDPNKYNVAPPVGGIYDWH